MCGILNDTIGLRSNFWKGLYILVPNLCMSCVLLSGWAHLVVGLRSSVLRGDLIALVS